MTAEEKDMALFYIKGARALLSCLEDKVRQEAIPSDQTKQLAHNLGRTATLLTLIIQQP